MTPQPLISAIAAAGLAAAVQGPPLVPEHLRPVFAGLWVSVLVLGAVGRLRAVSLVVTAVTATLIVAALGAAVGSPPWGPTSTEPLVPYLGLLYGLAGAVLIVVSLEERARSRGEDPPLPPARCR